MDNSKRKLLQEILTDRNWDVVEDYLEEYIANLNLKGSVKRQDEFHTIWDRAFGEGGEHHLRDFFKQIENEARKFNTTL
jgi:hypothetical protein